MSEIVAVSFVPKSKRARLRHVLSTGDTGDLKWRERKLMKGSEFYFSGPVALVMKTHAYVTWWVASPSK